MHTGIDIARFRHLYPFKSHYLDINGLSCHYLDEGAGQPIVMLHGNPTWSFYFRELIRGLSGRYRTIAPDHIGCGLSEKPGTDRYDYRLQSRVDDLGALMDHLGLRRDITLVLHDWGGAIGMAYALQHPDRIARLILMNTAAFLPPGNKRLPWRLRILRDFPSFATLAVLGLNLFAVAALHMAPHKRLSADVRAGLLAPYDSWRNRIALLKFVQDIPVCCRDTGYALLRSMDENLKRLSHLPMLICWGEHDFVFDQDYLSEWQARFPDAEVHRFGDAGHYVLEDQPRRILKLTEEFLSRHPL